MQITWNILPEANLEAIVDSDWRRLLCVYVLVELLSIV
jgi:hypothetical protein